MHYTDPNDGGDEAESIAKIQAVTPSLEDELRKLGIYVERTQGAKSPEGGLLLFVEARVGDIAFTDRVQNPDNHETKSQFRSIERDLKAQEFDDAKAELQKRAEEGQGFFDDEDDNE